MSMSQTIGVRRDQITIMGDLLVNTLEPKRLTHLLYGSNMSYSQLVKYLNTLIDLGLVFEEKKPFRTFMITEKGKSFMSIIKKIKLIKE
ncbi:MAG: 45 protein [Nitrosarchaeum sp.]|nr:45 protein [Nitrosarchaeum sp.]